MFLAGVYERNLCKRRRPEGEKLKWLTEQGYESKKIRKSVKKGVLNNVYSTVYMF
jgi:hypothetical protein